MRQRFVSALVVASVLALVVVNVGGAGAASRAPTPVAVTGATLTQQGRDVVWTVTFKHGFSPAHLAAQHTSVCLLLEHRSGLVLGQLCVAGPRPGSTTPRITYARVAHGQVSRATVVAATVIRGSSRELTASLLPSTMGLGYTPIGWQVLSAVRASACPAGMGAPPICSVRFPNRLEVASLHTPRVVGCVATGNPFVTQGPADRKVVALTFDDGPWSDTPAFLSLLEREHVNATFFEIGDQIATYGQGGAIERRMLADGDMVGDHTWSHPNVARAGAFAASQISRTAAAIKAVTGFSPCLFRAPYGSVSPALITEVRSMGMTTIQWDIDPRDWARPGTAAIYGNVIANARNGAIVIQHDGGGDRSQTLAALPVEIASLERRGYHFETITDMLGYRLIYK